MLTVRGIFSSRKCTAVNLFPSLLLLLCYQLSTKSYELFQYGVTFFILTSDGWSFPFPCLSLLQPANSPTRNPLNFSHIFPFVFLQLYLLMISTVKKFEIRYMCNINIFEGNAAWIKLILDRRYCPQKCCREFTRSSYYRFSNPSCLPNFVFFVPSCESPVFLSIFFLFPTFFFFLLFSLNAKRYELLLNSPTCELFNFIFS